MCKQFLKVEKPAANTLAKARLNCDNKLAN